MLRLLDERLSQAGDYALVRGMYEDFIDTAFEQRLGAEHLEMVALRARYATLPGE